jgi:ATP-dependent DNA helicase RecQ
VDNQLFDARRAGRRGGAAAKGLPPYTIFHDGTLRDVSRIRPTTLAALHQISGVGETKLREYGQDVLALVARVSGELGLSTDNADAGAASPPRPREAPATAEAAFPHFRAGKSVGEVAGFLDRAESTVREYLCAFIDRERPAGIDPWVDPATQERITAAARVHGSHRLKPVFLALDQEVPYDAIRIVLTFLNATGDRAEVQAPARAATDG